MVDQVIYDGETDNVAVAATPVVTATDGSFVVKVWSATGAFDSGTVNVYILASDYTPILLQAFTENGAYFGRVGSDELITADITGVAGAAADISCTVSRSR